MEMRSREVREDFALRTIPTRSLQANALYIAKIEPLRA